MDVKKEKPRLSSKNIEPEDDKRIDLLTKIAIDAKKKDHDPLDILASIVSYEKPKKFIFL